MIYAYNFIYEWHENSHQKYRPLNANGNGDNGSTGLENGTQMFNVKRETDNDNRI